MLLEQDVDKMNTSPTKDKNKYAKEHVKNDFWVSPKKDLMRSAAVQQFRARGTANAIIPEIRELYKNFPTPKPLLPTHLKSPKETVVSRCSSDLE